MEYKYDENGKYKERFIIIKRLCIIGGIMLASRHFQRLIFDSSYENYINTEWVNGNTLCTYYGNIHLAWSIPLADVSYYVPSVNLHMFLFFIPTLTFIENPRIIFTTIKSFIAGPLLASYLTNNLHEQASIWCFYSLLILLPDFIKFVYNQHLTIKNNK